MGRHLTLAAMIDLHCHVLPGIDDGPGTLDESVAMARVAAEQGTRTIVATPHVNTRFPNRAAEIADAVAAVNERLREDGVALEVLPGAEIALTGLEELDDDDLAAIGLGGSRWLLMECPFTLAIEGFAAAVRGLQGRGYGVVLAHPERCSGFHRHRELLAALVEEGTLTSITASSLTGAFGREPRRMAFDMFHSELVHNVASDAHDASQRSPELFEPISRAGLTGDQLEWLTRDVPAALIAGADPPPRPAGAPLPEPDPRGWRRLLRRA
jgi:protein-tyrosine phosphatase